VEQEHAEDGPAAQGARVGAEVGAQVGAVVGTALDEVGQRATQAAALLAETYGTVRERVVAAEPGVRARQWADTVESVVEQGRERAVATLPSKAPARRSRLPWPATAGRSTAPVGRSLSWSVGAAVGGAAGGVAVALLLRRLLGSDAPGAQEPEQLRAVVDTGQDVARPVVSPPAAGVAPVAPPAPQGSEGL
jgi:hypothetical protein